MKREEETKEAYKDYMNNVGMFRSNPWFYFKAGTEWADKHLANVWHDPREEPNINEYVVLRVGCGDFIIEFYDGDLTWHNIVLFHKATMWAYKDDIWPKNMYRCIKT